VSKQDQLLRWSLGCFGPGTISGCGLAGGPGSAGSGLGGGGCAGSGCGGDGRVRSARISVLFEYSLSCISYLEAIDSLMVLFRRAVSSFRIDLAARPLLFQDGCVFPVEALFQLD
jgi:hypothetical protein